MLTCIRQRYKETHCHWLPIEVCAPKIRANYFVRNSIQPNMYSSNKFIIKRLTHFARLVNFSTLGPLHRFSSFVIPDFSAADSSLPYLTPSQK